MTKKSYTCRCQPPSSKEIYPYNIQEGGLSNKNQPIEPIKCYCKESHLRGCRGPGLVSALCLCKCNLAHKKTSILIRFLKHFSIFYHFFPLYIIHVQFPCIILCSFNMSQQMIDIQITCCSHIVNLGFEKKAVSG